MVDLIVSFRDQQFDCLLLAAEGKTNAEVGELLGLSIRAVEQQLGEALHRVAVAKGVAESA